MLSSVNDAFLYEVLSDLDDFPDLSFSEPSLAADLFRLRIIPLPQPVTKSIRFNIQDFT